MNVTQVLRTYLGMSQVTLAQNAGINQPDLSEIETLPPYGKTSKYQKLSAYLGVPIEVLVKNDFTLIPDSFFERHPAPVYTPEPKDPVHVVGRHGEDYILRREQNRLASCWPALAKLVLPFYKLKVSSPGYDILSFDDQGKPFCLEIKTSEGSGNHFRITRHELDMAKKLTDLGEHYTVVYISNWGSETQTVTEIPYTQLQSEYNIIAHHYFCAPKSAKKEEPICGLTYFRRLNGLRQVDVAQELGVAPSNYCQYERGQIRPSITFYIRASKFYGTTVDSLLASYDPTQLEQM